jgi:hypothetical protein
MSAVRRDPYPVTLLSLWTVPDAYVAGAFPPVLLCCNNKSRAGQQGNRLSPLSRHVMLVWANACRSLP